MQPEPPAPPLPTRAWWSHPGASVTVRFDQALVPANLDTDNWVVYSGGHTYITNEAIALGTDVLLDVSENGLGPITEVVCFSPPPDDVVALATGLPAAGFTDFPIM